MDKLIIHRNKAWWGQSLTLILNGGIAFGLVSREHQSPQIAVIGGLSVTQEKQGKGWGNKILEACEREAVALGGVEKLLIYAEKDDFTAEWYKRHGYKPIPWVDNGHLIALEKEVSPDNAHTQDGR